MASNYQDILDQLHAAGLIVDTIETGRIIRCRVEGDREKRGWYVVHEITTGAGDQLLVGSFGIWHGSDQGVTKLEIRGGKSQISEDQRDLLRQRMREDRARADAERKAIARKAAQKAAWAWGKYSPIGESDYLARKGVAAHGVRFSPAGSVIVPLLDVAGVVHGLQIIRSKAAIDANKKRAQPRPDKEFWPTGIQKKGHFHLLGIPTWIVLVCEGYATGASLHEATGLPVAIAFDANNLGPVALALHGRYRQARILVCADDDIFAHHRVKEAGKETCGGRIVLPEHDTTCPHCHKDHGRINTGVSEASTAAVAGDGAFVVPRFADEAGRRAKFLERGAKLTDFNDLHAVEGLHVVRAQIEGRLSELHWSQKNAAPTTTAGQGGATLKPIESLDDLLNRFALVYGQSGTVFDRQEHCLVALGDVRDACISRYVHRFWMEHPARAIVRIRDVGFDPGGRDANITCNLWDGWPTKPSTDGKCDKLLQLLEYMCSNDDKAMARKQYEWVLAWLAYPIKVPGAKMKTTVVVHGPEGTGKNIFFDAVLSIYDRYGRIIGQDAIEDRFNDWASKKLFLIANEVVARSELYHVKNKLKSLITDDLIRINPKNMAAYDERNHVNLVFLSNEMIPVVLADDDRRYAVIYTPPPLPAEFYEAVAEELRHGGAAALHAYLLALDIGDFGEHSKPLLTAAKVELIEHSRDNISRFFFDLQDGDVPKITAGPALTKQVYQAYQSWCRATGHRSAPMNKLVGTFIRKHGVQLVRERWRDEFGTDQGPHGILLLGGLARAECPPGKDRRAWLGESIEAFGKQLKDASKEAA